MKTIWIYLIATVIFFAIDMVWLGVISKNLYRDKLGFILSDKINWTAAVIFYLIYIFGILFFAVNPALQADNWKLALHNGALLGLLCYATYDLTNMATIANWPLSIVVIDIVWGMLLTGSVSLLTFFVATKFL